MPPSMVCPQWYELHGAEGSALLCIHFYSFWYSHPYIKMLFTLVYGVFGPVKAVLSSTAAAIGTPFIFAC